MSRYYELQQKVAALQQQADKLQDEIRFRTSTKF